MSVHEVAASHGGVFRMYFLDAIVARRGDYSERIISSFFESPSKLVQVIVPDTSIMINLKKQSTRCHTFVNVTSTFKFNSFDHSHDKINFSELMRAIIQCVSSASVMGESNLHIVIILQLQVLTSQLLGSPS